MSLSPSAQPAGVVMLKMCEQCIARSECSCEDGGDGGADGTDASLGFCCAAGTLPSITRSFGGSVLVDWLEVGRFMICLLAAWKSALGSTDGGVKVISMK
jgi:hypothetical protein